jgi:hypothetical protein
VAENLIFTLIKKFPFPVILRLVALVGIDVSEVLKRATPHKIPEYYFLYSHRREKLKSYIVLIGWAL